MNDASGVGVRKGIQKLEKQGSKGGPAEAAASGSQGTTTSQFHHQKRAASKPIPCIFAYLSEVQDADDMGVIEFRDSTSFVAPSSSKAIFLPPLPKGQDLHGDIFAQSVFCPVDVSRTTTTEQFQQLAGAAIQTFHALLCIKDRVHEVSEGCPSLKGGCARSTMQDAGASVAAMAIAI